MMSNKIQSPWFVTDMVKSSSEINLFCFPYSGGGASLYRDWNKRFPSLINVFAIEYPGHESRIQEQPLDTLPNLVDLLCEEFRGALQKPFAFFGHSLGGKVAFETAKAISNRLFRSPLCCIIAGCSAPFLQIASTGDPGKDDMMRLLHAYRKTPVGLLEDAQAMDYFLPAVQADFAMERFCSPRGELAQFPLCVLAGEEDTICPLDEVRAWQSVAACQYELKQFPGGHFFPQTETRRLVHYITSRLLYYNRRQWSRH